jgi:transketolase C-terminal domain/subunit
MQWKRSCALLKKTWQTFKKVLRKSLKKMNKITIVWGTDKDKTKTYTFKNDKELKFFMMGVDEANGWLEYKIKE